MFDSPIHNPNASWRSEPATENQFRMLEDMDLPHSRRLTKGEAADLIGTHSEPDLDEIVFLRFFGVKGAGKLNQFEARQHIARIVAVPANRDRWECRPATKGQRALIKHIEGSVPSKLTEPEAERIISAIYQDDAKCEKAEAFENEQYEAEAAREDRNDAIRLIYDTIKEYPGYYGLKKVTLKDVRDAVAQIEAETGKTAIDLSDVNPDFEEVVGARIRSSGAGHASNAVRMSDGVTQRESIQWVSPPGPAPQPPEQNGIGWRTVLWWVLGAYVVVRLGVFLFSG